MPIGPILRWRFEKGRRALTCGVAATGAGTFDVVILAHWPGRGRSVQRFDQPGAAFLRHAMIASELRDAGWQLTRHSREW
jgi:hypothetical protein